MFKINEELKMQIEHDMQILSETIRHFNFSLAEKMSEYFQVNP